MTRQELKLQLIGSFIAGNRWDISTPGGKVIIYREVDAILERVLGPEITMRTPEEVREYERQEQFTPTDGQAFESFAEAQQRAEIRRTQEFEARVNGPNAVFLGTPPPMDAYGRVDLRARQTGRTQELRDEVAEAAANPIVIQPLGATPRGPDITLEDMEAIMRGSVQFEAEEPQHEPLTRRQRRGRGLATPIVLENEDGTETRIDSDAVMEGEEDVEYEEDNEEDTTTDDRQDEEAQPVQGIVFMDFSDDTTGTNTLPMTPEMAFGTPGELTSMPAMDDASFIDAMMQQSGALPEQNAGPSEPQVTITPVALRF